MTSEESIDLTPDVVWTDEQLVIVRDLAAKAFKAEEAVKRVEALIESPYQLHTDYDLQTALASPAPPDEPFIRYGESVADGGDRWP